MTSFRDAGRVLRYHATRTLQQQSVGEHTWQILRIYTEIWGPPSGAASAAILVHDAPEVLVGDTPHPAKARWPALRAALDEAETEVAEEMLPDVPRCSPDEEFRIKLCDLIEMWEFGQDEALLGSARGRRIAETAGRVVVRMLEGRDMPEVSGYMERRQRQVREMERA